LYFYPQKREKEKEGERERKRVGEEDAQRKLASRHWYMSTRFDRKGPASNSIAGRRSANTHDNSIKPTLWRYIHFPPPLPSLTPYDGTAAEGGNGS